MADLVITKSSTGFWHVQSSGSSQLTGTKIACIRANTVGTTSWIRTGAFTTGNKEVTKITLYLTDCQTTTSYSSATKGYFGISATKHDTWSSAVPSFTWTSGAVSYKAYNGLNGYTATFTVNLQPNTTYYAYIYCGGSGSTAWDCITRPQTSSDSRITQLHITYDTYTTPTYTITYNANGGSGAPSNQTKYKNKSITLSSTTPTRTGYDFVGWGSGGASDTSKDYDPGATYSGNANLTLHAIWKAKGLVRIYDGSSWRQALCYVYDGSTWRQAVPYVYNGSSWQISG